MNNKRFKGKRHSDETKKKMSESHRLSSNKRFKGKRHSDETKKKLSESHKHSFARILVHGKDKIGKMRYALVCDGIRIKTSNDINKLRKHPIYNRGIDLSQYKCFNCIYYEEYNKCSVFSKMKYTPQSCIMFNFGQKICRSIS